MPENWDLYFCGIRSLRYWFVIVYFPHVSRSHSSIMMFIAVSVNYLEDISHWASSSTQTAACSFEPGTPEDVGIAVSVLH